MHSTFAVYVHLGFDHIADLRGYDHILFVVALSAGYGLAQWRQLLVLVTAFTVGHSLTLALATLRLVSVSSAWVEFLIPLTIVATGVYTLVETAAAPRPDHPPQRARRVKYAMALLFGLIHGLGFSTFLRALLGEEESIALPLFSFNVGLEVGQIVILAAALAMSAAASRWTPLRPGRWTMALSGGAALVAVYLAATRHPF